jgi:hypothetical protein
MATGVEQALSSYFDDIVPDESPWYETPEGKSVGRMKTTTLTMAAFSSAGDTIDVGAIPASDFLLNEPATLPPYRYCRPIRTIVQRSTEEFTSFIPCIITDAETEFQTLQYTDSLRRADLYEQPDRAHDGWFLIFAPADLTADIISHKVWTDLVAAGVQPDAINRTKLLPLHQYDAADLDLLRDLPAFPVKDGMHEGDRPSKRRALAWAEGLPAHPDTFGDDVDRYHLDSEEKLCALPSCRTFGCGLHLPECTSPRLLSPG